MFVAFPKMSVRVAASIKSNAAQQPIGFFLGVGPKVKTMQISLMMIITPDIVSSYINLKVCEKTNENTTLAEHELIFDCIINQNDNEASNAMGSHLEDVSQFSINMK